MKTLRYLQMATLVATLGLASCTNDDAPMINDSEFKIVATLGDIQTRVNSESDGGKFLSNDTIYVATESISNCDVAFVTDKGTINGVAEFKPVNEKLVWQSFDRTFYAANNSYVLARLNSYGLQFPIQTNQSSVDSLRRADIILAEPKQLSFESTNGIIPLKFVHAMSKVTVNIVAYNGFGNIDVKDMVVENVVFISRQITDEWAGVSTNCEFTDGELRIVDDSRSIMPEYEYLKYPNISPLVTKDSSTGMYSFTAIIKPWTYSEGDVFMRFVIGGLEYKVLANSDLCTEGFLQPGKHYHFDLTVNKKASASLSKVSLLDWDEEEFTKFRYN